MKISKKKKKTRKLFIDIIQCNFTQLKKHIYVYKNILITKKKKKN